MSASAQRPAGSVPAYYDRVNTLLLERIVADAGMVLEIGCGAGALGAAYKRINPSCRYVGVEVVADAAALARQRLDEVHVMDVEQQPLPLDPALKADVLIYGDVLEHLREPAATLRQHLAHLADDGLLLCCIPNVQHFSAIEHVLNGRWPADEEGLFDRTHLRWFTRDSMAEMLHGLGLKVLDFAALSRASDVQDYKGFHAKLRPALINFGIDEQRFAERASAQQFVIRAVQRQPAPLMIHALTLRPAGGVNDVRVTQPLRSLATRPGIVVREEVAEARRLSPRVAGQPRIFLWQRPIFTAERNLLQLRQLLDLGYLPVVEFDDHPSYKSAIAEHGYLTFRGALAVQTSTEPLAAYLRQFNPEVAVFPNTVVSLPETAQNFGTPGRLTLFFGAFNREEDWPPYMDALNRVAGELGERLAFEVVYDRQFFDALTTPHKRFTQLTNYATYQQLMARCEVCFMPLADSEFNRMKSDLKFVEAGAHGLAALASPVVYAGTITDGETGLICADGEALAGALRRLVSAPDEARALGRRAHAWVRANRLQGQQIKAREAWYRSLWERRAELTAALLERVPELRR